jgi:hypothetical protein
VANHGCLQRHDPFAPHIPAPSQMSMQLFSQAPQFSVVLSVVSQPLSRRPSQSPHPLSQVRAHNPLGQVPSVPAWVPTHGWLQQVPLTQMFDRHALSVGHPAPFAPFARQVPESHHRPPPHWRSLPQEPHAVPVGMQIPVAHGCGGLWGQLPLPSQLAAGVRTPLVHEAGRHDVPTGCFWQMPPEQTPVVPQVTEFCTGQGFEQRPQWLECVWVSTQAPLQSVKPLLQAVTQVPSWQIAVPFATAAHVTPAQGSVGCVPVGGEVVGGTDFFFLPLPLRLPLPLPFFPFALAETDRRSPVLRLLLRRVRFASVLSAVEPSRPPKRAVVKAENIARRDGLARARTRLSKREASMVGVPLSVVTKACSIRLCTRCATQRAADGSCFVPWKDR